MSLKKELPRTLAATVLFLLISGIFGFGGCMTLAGEFGGRSGAGIVLGFVWFFLVACGAMWLNLRMFGKDAKRNSDDPQP
jgi:hypothetical protein